MPITRVPKNPIVEAIRSTAQRMQQPIDDNVLKARLLGFLGAILENQLPTVEEQLLPMPATIATAGAKALTRIKNPIEAWHGTPYNFPAERLIRRADGSMEYLVGKPDVLPDVPHGATVIEDYPLGRARLDKIGTGMGAQIEGHGLSFAGARAQAKYIKNLLSGGSGHLYKANLHIDPNELLDMNIPLSQQKNISSILSKSPNDDIKLSLAADYSGRDLYDAVSKGSEQMRRTKNARAEATAASRILRDMGIPGSTHYSGWAAVGRPAAKNYVIWDENRIELVKKFGIALVLGAGLISQAEAEQLKAQGYQ